MPSGLAAVEGVSMGSSPSMTRPLCAPPRRFLPAGRIQSAWLSEGPFAHASSGGTPAQRAGLRYEAKVLKHLAETFPGFQPSRWMSFQGEGGRRRFCQVDGLLAEGALAIFEVKLRFTSDAYFQLSQLYKPVVEAIYGRSVESLVVVCKYFDPATPFPSPIYHVSSLDLSALRGIPRERVGVYTWRR